jgi:uncharacterized pyridoxal phosphate-dependent enzyme
MKRRDILKGLSLLPLSGAIGAALPIETVEAAPARTTPKRDLWKELGVTPYISCGGTVTVNSGSLMMPETVEAINSTAHNFANMYELQDKAGAKIAEMLHCEGAMVTAGAASALLLATAACITIDKSSPTGVNPELVKSLPFPPGPQREVIMQKGHRYRFDQQVTTCGVKIVEVVTIEDMEKAFTPNTVMALFKNNDPPPEYHTTISREDFVAICKKHNVPSMIDAAADVPPVTNLYKFQKMGFDLVTFSGGKMIRGPQSAGLLFGRKDLIEAAKQNHSPNESPIGRPCKVNKEEIFGMYAALKSYLERDHEKEWQDWLDRMKRIATKVQSTVPTVKYEVRTPPPSQPANNYPTMNLTWDTSRVKISGQEASEALRTGTPAIQAGAGRGSAPNVGMLSVGVVLLEPEQVDIVAKRIKEVLEGAVQKIAKT